MNIPRINNFNIDSVNSFGSGMPMRRKKIILRPNYDASDTTCFTSQQNQDSFANVQAYRNIKSFYDLLTGCSAIGMIQLRRKYPDLSNEELKVLHTLSAGSKPYRESNYSKLSYPALEAAREQCCEAGYVVDENLHYTDMLKKSLDEYYGKDKYTFVSVGRSPSTIARCISKRGVPTIYCPISNLGNEQYKDARGTFFFHRYLNYLKSLGLKPDEVAKSSRKFLVYDYTQSGESLRNFEKILVDDLKLPRDKVVARSINQDIADIEQNKDDVLDFIMDMFTCSDAERYGGVPYFPTTCLRSPRNVKLNSDCQLGYNQFTFSLQDRLARELKKK